MDKDKVKDRRGSQRRRLKDRRVSSVALPKGVVERRVAKRRHEIRRTKNLEPQFIKKKKPKKWNLGIYLIILLISLIMALLYTIVFSKIKGAFEDFSDNVARKVIEKGAEEIVDEYLIKDK